MAEAVPLTGFAALRGSRILIASDASPAVRFAAEELQRSVAQITGQRLPIAEGSANVEAPCMFVGDGPALRRWLPALPALGAEELLVDACPPHLALVGQGDRGVLYAVYEFLGSLGCRWYTPEVERIPERGPVEWDGVTRRAGPAFGYREVYYREASDQRWCVRNRLNACSGAEIPAENGGAASKRGGHSFGSLLPPDRHAERHPEYYALANGKRSTDNLCLTDPDVMAIASEALLQGMEEKPEADLYSVFQNDNFTYCHCERCEAVNRREGSPAGTLIQFVNALAERACRVHPGKRLITLAYQYSDTPPAHLEVHPSVVVQLCHMGYCDAHPLDGCERNEPYMRKLRGWVERCRELYIWHYVTNFAHYLLPFPNLRPLAEDLRIYRDAGVAGIFCQGNIAGRGEMAELRSWFLSRLLWDPDLDPDCLMGEFLDAFYGPAAEAVADYLELVEESVRRAGCHFHLYGGYHVGPGVPEDNLPLYLTPEVLDRARDILEGALRECADNAIRARVERVRLWVEYARLMTFGGFAIVDMEFLLRKAHPGADMEMLQAFVGDARRHGVHDIREGLSLDRFVEPVLGRQDSGR